MNRQDTKGAKNRNEPSEVVDRLAHSVIGAAIEVHRHLGPGYLESVYEEALAVELSLRPCSKSMCEKGGRGSRRAETVNQYHIS